MRFDSRRLVAESLGTFFLVLIGPGAVMVNAWSNGAVTHVGVALSFGFVVTAMIYALGHLSGAHINPAVTVGFWSVRRFAGRDVIPYIVAQCIGATLASVTMRGAIGAVGSLGATIPAVSIHAAFSVEFLLSFVLMFVIMGVATDERVANGFAAIAVGLTVGFCALVGGPMTGASMNPARSFGPAVVGGLWDAQWLYWIAPLLGAVCGARTYEYLRATRAPSAARNSALRTQGAIDSVDDGAA